MENNNTLKDVALMCECSEKVSSFGILADFMKFLLVSKNYIKFYYGTGK